MHLGPVSPARAIAGGCHSVGEHHQVRVHCPRGDARGPFVRDRRWTCAGLESEATFVSTSTVRFAARRPGSSTWIDLLAEEVLSAELNGRPLDVSGYDGARLALAASWPTTSSW